MYNRDFISLDEFMVERHSEIGMNVRDKYYIWREGVDDEYWYLRINGKEYRPVVEEDFYDPKALINVLYAAYPKFKEDLKVKCFPNIFPEFLNNHFGI